MNTKHKPATGLPWVAAYGSSTIRTFDGKGTVAAAIKSADVAYLAHTANAYPELVEALKAMRAAFWGTSHNETEDAANEMARALLTKLGEA